MSRAVETIRCQKCRAVNPVQVEFCDVCGTRLMLVTTNAAHQFENEDFVEAQNAMLAERVATLEHNLSRVCEQVEKVLELMGQQTGLIHANQAVVESLVAVLTQTGTLELREMRQAVDEPIKPRDALPPTDTASELSDAQAKVQTGKRPPRRANRKAKKV